MLMHIPAAAQQDYQPRNNAEADAGIHINLLKLRWRILGVLACCDFIKIGMRVRYNHLSITGADRHHE